MTVESHTLWENPSVPESWYTLIKETYIHRSKNTFFYAIILDADIVSTSKSGENLMNCCIYCIRLLVFIDSDLSIIHVILCILSAQLKGLCKTRPSYREVRSVDGRGRWYPLTHLLQLTALTLDVIDHHYHTAALFILMLYKKYVK